MKEDQRDMWHEWGLRGMPVRLQLGNLKKRGTRKARVYAGGKYCDGYETNAVGGDGLG